MNDHFNIYVDRLRGGAVENIQRSFVPDFLKDTENEFSFPDEIAVDGNVYITDNNLVIQTNISTNVLVPCTICNQPVSIPIDLHGVYHVVPTEEIEGGVYNMQEMLRENILIEIPAFIECNEGHCAQRSEIEKYLHRSSDKDDAEEGYQPFKDL